MVHVPAPRRVAPRIGLGSRDYISAPLADYAEQDAKNRQLGTAGELAVIASEKAKLLSAGRADLAGQVLHVAKTQGDSAGYDVKSFSADGGVKYIEVKTTRGGAATAFYLSSNEVAFSASHVKNYYLYRVFDFDENLPSGKVFVQRGNVAEQFSLTAVVFKARIAPLEASNIGHSAIAKAGG